MKFRIAVDPADAGTILASLRSIERMSRAAGDLDEADNSRRLYESLCEQMNIPPLPRDPYPKPKAVSA